MLIPEYFIYDDACRFRLFLQKKGDKQELSPRLQKITPDKVKYVVDKMHIKGHVDPWCKANCDPQWFPDLKLINTQVCEQTNYWGNRYKFSLKYMNFLRYNFFLFIIFNEFNKIKLLKIYQECTLA